MDQSTEAVAGADRASQRNVCPGVSNSVCWDEPTLLRGEIYSEEHLVQHAADVARAHGKPSLRITPGPLRTRFSTARARIREAYDFLAREFDNKREPTPAEEWLLDNSHVVDEQIREIQEDLPWGYLVELPRLAHGAMRGYPRVYGLCLDYLRHTDARVDLTSLASYVLAYQSVSNLTIGELWAVPIMLRLGLTLVVGGRAVSEAAARDRALGDEWADRLIERGDTPARLSATLTKLNAWGGPYTDGFLTQLLKRLREHEAPLSAAAEWVRARCEAMGVTPEELTRRQHLRQAGDQVSVGNAITSMRAIGALDWSRFFELTSAVESVLQQDPAAAYREMDEQSRDQCRHAVERLARRSRVSEVDVAQAALALARSAGSSEAPLAHAHVGYYLLDAGRRRLEQRIAYRPSLAERLRRFAWRFPTLSYLGTLGVLLGLASALALDVLLSTLSDPWVVLATLLVLLIPLSEVALSLLNAVVVLALPPRLLPKLSFKEGIPDQHRTLVVVPCLLDGLEQLQQLLEDLEVRSLANSDPNLYFALLTDFTDAPQAETADDRELLDEAVQGIARLNQRYAPDAQRYLLLHRGRIYNSSEAAFIGWERKRGKLEELNRLLRGATDTTFTLISAPLALLHSFRYVITLDADTELPRDVASRLVGALAHPLNRPLLDPERQRVISGYGLIQPRVGTLPQSSRRSLFARVFSGPPGIDPYTTAVSDVYQDLFAEGSFVGKAIYDVDAFQAALAGRSPENHLLSHDLFEGSFARCALATDIEVLDEQPSTYEMVASRQHRWLRGDWQLLPWLFPRVPANGGRSRSNDLRLLDLWKMIDNLRRSLVPPSLVGLCVASWFLAPALAPAALVLLASVFVAPLLLRQLFAYMRAAVQPKPNFGALGGEFWKNALQLALGVALLCDQALLTLDGIWRTLYRLGVSRRRLLQWKTMSQTTRQLGLAAGVSRRFALSGALAVLCLFGVAVFSVVSLWLAAPLLVTWAFAPALFAWLSRPRAETNRVAELSEADRLLLRTIARKTWRFFEEFVTEEDHWLPPDNYQEDPRGVLAHRTSPTNIGLYLLSVVAARDFGFITHRDVVERLERTLATLAKMEQRSGHILNWYDTTSLAPLEPQYVSTVDSGNLAAYLWTLREACVDLVKAPLLDGRAVQAAGDALRIAVGAQRQDAPSASQAPAEVQELERSLTQALALLGLNHDEETVVTLETLAGSAAALRRSAWARSAGGEVGYWLGQVESPLRRSLDQVRQIAPCLEWLLAAPQRLSSDAALGPVWRELTEPLHPSSSLVELAAACPEGLACLQRLDELLVSKASIPPYERLALASYLQELRERLRATGESCADLVRRSEQIAMDAAALADGMDFKFLFDDQRQLFSIGYNVGSARLDGSHYDLLASEARLASLIAISKGDVPLEHWFRLARPRTESGSGRVLLSWSGSMFEYLMPLLVTGSQPETLLGSTYLAALGRQQSYAAAHGVPWGVSESAYNVMDLGMTYQYRAFGVPGLGFKSGLGDDLVVAPYATALAAMLRVDHAVANFRALSGEGLEGKYGYYEAVDYTTGHVPPGRRSVVVKAFMAHHQGMSLVALCNVLCGAPMQRRFFADPRIKASALLLQERVPVSAPLIPVRTMQAPTALLSEPELNLTDHVGIAARALPRVHLLGHGQLSALIASTGAGVVTWKGLDVNRFREDAALECGGTYIYVRDLGQRRLWSAGYLPTRVTPDFYDAAFSIDRVELRRRDGELETVTEIAVSPEHPAEVRRITITNHGTQACELDLTTYMEVVLAPRARDVAHRAFSSMFVETEILVERGAILARRRPRSASEQENWLVQILCPESDGFETAEFESSRARFLGRLGSTEKPAAMHFSGQMTGHAGAVLDPILAIRRKMRVEPGKRARATLTTALASSREAALELVERYSAGHGIARAFELAWADARVELKHLGISGAQSHRFQRLLSCLVFAPASLRDVAAPGLELRRGRSALWANGISGDLPILLLRIDHPDFAELCRELLLAHEFWRLNGIEADLVILNEEPAGYLQPLQEAVLDLIRSSPAQGHENQRGGVFLRRLSQISPEEQALLRRAARVVLRSSAGSLSQQLRRVQDVPKLPEPLIPPRRVKAPVRTAAPAPAARHFFNGIGGFTADAREYVMSLSPGLHSPMPWCNVMANPNFGSIISESGSGFTWFGNSQRERLSPWSNDAVADPSGEVLYVRDDEDGSFWSATPAPASLEAHFQVAHGQGYSVFSHTQHELQQELLLLVSPRDPVKLLRLTLRNVSTRTRHLSCFLAVEWVLGDSREATRTSVSSAWDASARALLAENPFAPEPGRRAFLGSSADVASYTGDRHEWFGMCGTRAAPAALQRRRLSGRVGVGLDPCGVVQLELSLGPGETRELCFALGQGKDSDQARALARVYLSPTAAAQALEELKRTWDELLGAITVKTPDLGLDFMINRWLLYQVTSARLWGRSGFYQSSGAYGFRDQLQDVLALLQTKPHLAREHLLRAAARQFVEGDVQHWWHPESGEGVRTHCSDDLLWLPFAVAEYVRCTADHEILEQRIPFLQERRLATAEEDLFAAPASSEQSESLYEHCVRALDAGTTSGPRGLPKMGTGDWNDGMNHVGVAGVGESVWLAWFLAKTLLDFAEVAAARGDTQRVERCQSEAKRLAAAVEQHAWDGSWYQRAYYDDGTPLGSRASVECQIDAIAQSWAVISGVADPERARRALQASESRLIREPERMMLLLTPPFEASSKDPGYIRGYPAGLRENGGQYTHGVLWTVQALCRLGEGDRAERLLALLNPISHAIDPSDVQRYQVEPYVVAADVYAHPQHLGRGGWTWYTGSAAWMYRVAVESLLGLRRRGATLEISPCIPAHWLKFEVSYRFGSSEYQILVDNSSGVNAGVRRIDVDGQVQAEPRLVLRDDGGRRVVRVFMGDPSDSGRTSRPSDAPASPALGELA